MRQLGRKMWAAKMFRKGSWRCHELKDCAIIEMLEGDPGPYEFIVFTPDELKQHEEALLREGWDAALSHEKEVTLNVNGTRLEKIKMRTYDSIDHFLKSREKE